MAMKTITFSCETITPMFLSGADGSTPELRPPSIKGALRFWWRAMNGHLATTESGGITNLLKEDEELFGGVNNGGKSKVSVRVFDLENENDLIDGNEIKNYCERNDTKGLAYLFYILVNNQQKDKYGFRNLKFKISLSSKNIDDLHQAVASFWILVNLGGLGSRARRGAGGIKVINPLKGNEYLLDIESKTIIYFIQKEGEKVIDFYSNNYKRCIKILNKPNANENHSKDIDLYSTLTTNEVYISNDPFKSWNLALEDIGSKMREVRLTYEAYDNDKFTLYDIPLKAAFGLPIKIRDTKPSERNPKGFMGYYVELLNSQRRSSSLVISIYKVDTEVYHWVLTYLDGQFSEQDNPVVVRDSKKNVYVKDNHEFSKLIEDEHYNLVTDFLNKLSKTKIEL
jgi:CRISPR-associated protein Cmr1